jgi:hypothetical protein
VLAPLDSLQVRAQAQPVQVSADEFGDGQSMLGDAAAGWRLAAIVEKEPLQNLWHLHTLRTHGVVCEIAERLFERSMKSDGEGHLHPRGKGRLGGIGLRIQDVPGRIVERRCDHGGSQRMVRVIAQRSLDLNILDATCGRRRMGSTEHGDGQNRVADFSGPGDHSGRAARQRIWRA